MTDHNPNEGHSRFWILFEIVVGIVLVYLFFEPGKEAISGFLKNLL